MEGAEALCEILHADDDHRVDEDADVPPVGPKNDGCLSGPSFEVVESKPNKFRLTHGVVGWLAGRTLYDHRG